MYTLKEKRGALWNMLIGFAAIVMALAGWELYAGICYLFIPVLIYLNELRFTKERKKDSKKQQKTNTWNNLSGKWILIDKIFNDSVAQLAEQLTLNQRAESSNLSGVTFKYITVVADH